MPLAVLASGTGSIYKAIVDSTIDVAVVLVDRPCAAIDLANTNQTPCITVERTQFGPDFDRAKVSCDGVAALAEFNVDVVAMAGFGTVLGAPFFEAY